ncbi:hypothetical protein EBZ39_00320 [bacterium]|nr:hypothetical protein [bacterium]
MLRTPIPDLYQVKWFDQRWRYGIVSRWEPESIKSYNEARQVIVADAVTPESYRVDIDDLQPVPMSFDPPDEYKQYVDEQYHIVKSRSDSLPPGSQVGKLFRVPAGDGYAYYVITKVNKKTVDIEWRGFSLDRWIDIKFSGGGREPRDLIDRLVAREDAAVALFSRR